MCFHRHLWVVCHPCVFLWHLGAVPQLACVYKGISVQHVKLCVLGDEPTGGLSVYMFAQCICVWSVSLCLHLHLCVVCRSVCVCTCICVWSVSLCVFVHESVSPCVWFFLQSSVCCLAIFARASVCSVSARVCLPGRSTTVCQSEYYVSTQTFMCSVSACECLHSSLCSISPCMHSKICLCAV